MNEEIRQVELPGAMPQDFEGIRIGGDLNKLAENMTDKDRNALLIQVFRQQTEILNFTRAFQGFMDNMSNSPMAAMMMGGGLSMPGKAPSTLVKPVHNGRVTH